MILGSLVLCSGSNTSFGFWMIKNLTQDTFNPKNLMSSSTYMDKGMPPQLALLRSSKLFPSGTAPSAGPSCGLKCLLKYVCHIRLTMLPVSRSEDMLSPILLMSTLGNFATALYIILNWVFNDSASILGPLPYMSHLGFGEL